MGKTTEGGVTYLFDGIVEDGPDDDLSILRGAFEEWLNYIDPTHYPPKGEREALLRAFIAGATMAGADFDVVSAAQHIGYPPPDIKGI